MIQEIDFAGLWREELKNQEGTYSLRMTDDAAERAFWHSFMEKKDVYKQDGWAARITPVLRELILPRCPETILEIGPGWGNFTAELAECCRQLSCLDISPDVLSFLKEKVPQKEGKPEIRPICSKWEDCVPEKTYDVVFGYNCFYRMLDLKDCIRKMNAAAGKLCVMGMGTGERKIYLYFVNLLFQMGIAAEVRVIPLDEEEGSGSSLTRRLGVLVYWEPVKEP